MNTQIRTAMLASAITAILGCSSLPDRVDTLEQARADVRRLEQDKLASEVAATELAAARTAIEEADEAYEDKEDLVIVEHKAYVAQRYADISEQRIAEAHAKETIASGETERNRVLLEARTREAEALEERNRVAEARNLEAEQRNSALQDQAQALANEAAAAAQEAAAAAERNRELEAQLSDLQAKQTERGLVLTLGDVLFDTAQSTLKPGAESTIDRLAQFMRDYPDRQVMIEGHTDSRGSDDFNRDLSKRRADAVRDALTARNIGAQRIRSVGLGEAYPIAGNDSSGGMQQNRRVEIVISDEQGAFPTGSERTAAATR